MRPPKELIDRETLSQNSGRWIMSRLTIQMRLCMKAGYDQRRALNPPPRGLFLLQKALPSGSSLGLQFATWTAAIGLQTPAQIFPSRNGAEFIHPNRSSEQSPALCVCAPTWLALHLPSLFAICLRFGEVGRDFVTESNIVTNHSAVAADCLPDSCRGHDCEERKDPWWSWETSRRAGFCWRWQL